MTKRQDLYFQRCSRSEQSDQRQPNQAANISHQPRASPNSTALTSRIEFPTMTARPGRPERNRAARSFRQLRRFHHGINSDKVFGTHTALMPKTIESVWAPLYAKLAEAYLDRLPRGEVVDLFPALAGPLAARILAHAMGVPDASDEDMHGWSQCLIDGAGNFGWTPGPFDASDIANAEMDKC